jgi:hypothetical protein
MMASPAKSSAAQECCVDQFPGQRHIAVMNIHTPVVRDASIARETCIVAASLALS